jgi:hypothetical protein
MMSNQCHGLTQRSSLSSYFPQDGIFMAKPEQSSHVTPGSFGFFNWRIQPEQRRRLIGFCQIGNV